MSRVLVLLTAISVTGVFASTSVAEPEQAVSLLLHKATGERWERDIHFQCEVALDNALGRDLGVRSAFFSVFDGLQIVVTTPTGKVLAQQGYTFHQSPFAPLGRVFPLQKGETVGTLVFPINGLPNEIRSVKVRLVGTLPGSGYDRMLSSETLAVEVKPRRP